MTDLETKIITAIRENPKTMERAIDILTRMENGESIESIAARYGVTLEEGKTI